MVLQDQPAVEEDVESEEVEVESDGSESDKSPEKPTASIAPSKPSSAGSKRSLETEKSGKNKDLKKKKKVGQPEEDGNESFDFQRTPFQRLFSEDDEIVILKGIRDFIREDIDPFSLVDCFLDSIKKSLSVNVKKDQLYNKMRRLRSNFLKNPKMGEDPASSKSHEVKSYKLAKEIWGELVRNNQKGGEEGNYDEYGKTNGTPNHGNLPIIMGDSLLKEGLGLIGDSKAKELEKKWRNLHIEELKVYLKRLELLQEQAMVFLKAFKSSDA